MGVHYNAFISYRHHPEDIRVATEIHRLLERFRVPGNLRKKTRKIERIFRDKEELPITSNLTDDISEALRNSEYLIVICSEHTKESVWVQREIETFLQTHPRSKVLTVLAGGDPYAVIPEILLREETEDPVTGEKYSREVEPLSCDWRLPVRVARREELPRLAAVLLGCSYDELRQRQRQYRTRRLIAMLTATVMLSLALAGYFLYYSITIRRANVQIRMNLDEALRNQSLYLSNVAAERLEAGDRLGAIALAMEALPKYPGERPYLAEAEYVLLRAIGVYMPGEITAVGALGRDDGIVLRDFWIAKESPLVLIQDERGILTTWDTDAMVKMGTLPVVEPSIDDVLFTKDGTVVIRTNDLLGSVYALTPEGMLLWQTGSVVDISYLSDDTLLLLSEENERYRLRYVDPETGENCAPGVEFTVPEPDSLPVQILSGGTGIGSPVVLKNSDIYQGERMVWALRPGSTELVPILRGANDVCCALVTEDGKLTVMTIMGEFSSAGRLMGSRITAPQEYAIFCYDLQTGDLLWERGFETYFYTGTTQLLQLPAADMLLCVSGNVLQTLSLADGEVLAYCETGTGILATNITASSVLYILEDGYVGTFDYGSGECYEFPTMEGDLYRAEFWNGMYGLQLYGDQVTFYKYIERDRTWRQTNDGYTLIAQVRMQGDLLAYNDYEDQFLFSCSKQELLWKSGSGYCDVLDFSEDGSRLWTVGYGGELTTYYTEDGRSSLLQLPVPDDTYVICESGYGLYEDRLYYLVTGGMGMELACYDMIGEKVEMHPINGEDYEAEDRFPDGASVLGSTDGVTWALVGGQHLYAVDHEDGSVLKILETESTVKLICRDGATAIFAVGDKVYGYSGTEQVLSLALDGVGGCSAVCWEEDLFVLCDNARVYRFDRSGALLWDAEVDVYTDFASSAATAEEWDFGWYFAKDDKLIVNALGVGTVIDRENGDVCAGFPNLVGYDAENNVIILNDDGALAGVYLYSTEELLEIAREQLNGYTLSEQERRYYGIE